MGSRRSTAVPRTAVGQQFFTQPRTRHDQRSSASETRLSDATARRAHAIDATIRIIENDVECGEFVEFHFCRNRSRNVQTVLQGKTESVPGQIYY